MSSLAASRGPLLPPPGAAPLAEAFRRLNGGGGGGGGDTQKSSQVMILSIYDQYYVMLTIISIFCAYHGGFFQFPSRAFLNDSTWDASLGFPSFLSSPGFPSPLGLGAEKHEKEAPDHSERMLRMHHFAVPCGAHLCWMPLGPEAHCQASCPFSPFLPFPWLGRELTRQDVEICKPKVDNLIRKTWRPTSVVSGWCLCLCL